VNKSRGETILYWAIFVFGAIVAGYHTFMVNLLVNPWYIALPSALAVDGLLAYSIHCVKAWTGDKKIASLGAIILFACVSAVAQIIYHQTKSGIVLDPWLLFFATFVIPIASSTGSFVTIAVIQLFKQDGEKEYKPPSLSMAIVNKPAESVSNNDLAVSNWPQPASLAMDSSPMKRKAGRPPKQFGTEVSASPKAVKK
jgi:TM2 domain-containing membrane protein YozV